MARAISEVDRQYGASDEQYRHLMAPSLLQWKAMKLCRARGCTRYDLLGIDAPPDGAATHPNEPQRVSSAWAGVTRFKKQFGGAVMIYPKEREIVLRPMMKKFIEWKREVMG